MQLNPRCHLKYINRTYHTKGICAPMNRWSLNICDINPHICIQMFFSQQNLENKATKRKEAKLLSQVPHLLCINSYWMFQRASNTDPQRCSSQYKSVLSNVNDSLSIIYDINWPKQRGKYSRGGWGGMVLIQLWHANRTSQAFISIHFRVCLKTILFTKPPTHPQGYAVE